MCHRLRLRFDDRHYLLPASLLPKHHLHLGLARRQAGRRKQLLNEERLSLGRKVSNQSSTNQVEGGMSVEKAIFFLLKCVG